MVYEQVAWGSEMMREQAAGMGPGGTWPPAAPYQGDFAPASCCVDQPPGSQADAAPPGPARSGHPDKLENCFRPDAPRGADERNICPMCCKCKDLLAGAARPSGDVAGEGNGGKQS